MFTLFELRVEPLLPPPLEPLRELAYNLWWAWSPIVVKLFRRIDD